MVSDSERFNKTMQEAAKYRVQCECGKASAIFYPFEHKTKKLCRACGNYIYSDEKEKFKNRLETEIWKRK